MISRFIFILKKIFRDIFQRKEKKNNFKQKFGDLEKNKE